MLVCLHSNRDPRLLEKSRALATVIRLTIQIDVTVATGVHQLMVVAQPGRIFVKIQAPVVPLRALTRCAIVEFVSVTNAKKKDNGIMKKGILSQ